MNSPPPDPAIEKPVNKEKPLIPDHSMIRMIGRGSYGDVWLAKNMMGIYRAVKVVYRQRFTESRPYERELEGIRNYEPISRTYEGFIDILHMGYCSEKGFFYYVMELGDDLNTNDSFDPDTYTPKTLEKAIELRGKLPVEECLELGLSLTSALRQLHARQLVHRDVKPSNIIFVNGIPKLADIGLVTDMLDTHSFVGTEGFTPPEGPGTPQADVYGLGKVLYEMSTGKDRNQFPEWPEDLEEGEQHQRFLELNEVLLRACSPKPSLRYRTAREMNADLSVIDNGQSVQRLRVLEKRLKDIRRWAGIIVVVSFPIILLGLSFYNEYKRDLQARQRLAGASVVQGNQSMEQGDYINALPHFIEALRLDQGDKFQESLHRLRIGTVLSRTPKLIQLWQMDNRIRSVSFSPDGAFALAVGRRGGATVWDMATGLEKFTIHNVPRALSGCFHPNGQSIAVANGKDIIFFNLTEGTEIGRLHHTNDIFRISFSVDGNRLATVGNETMAVIWDLSTKSIEQVLSGHTKPIRWVSFSPNGEWIATAGQDGLIFLWETKTGRQVWEQPFQHKNWVYKVSFSPDSRRLASASFDRSVKIWDLTTGLEQMPPLRHGDGVTDVNFSPDGRYIVTACMDATLRLWNAQTHLPLSSAPILPHSHRVMACNFSPEGRRIISGCEDRTVRVWDLGSTISIPESIKGKLSNQGRYYLHQETNGWTVRTTLNDQIVRRIPRHEGIERIDFDRLGSHVIAQISSTSNTLAIWNLRQGERKGHILNAWNFPLKRTRISADGQRVAGWNGRNVHLSNLPATSNEITTLTFPFVVTNMAFSPVNRTLAVVSSNQVFVLDGITGKHLFPPLVLPGQGKYIAFESSGKRLGICCSDLTTADMAALVWDLETGEQVGQDLKHYDGVLHLSFHPDGERVITGGEDNVAVLWEQTTGRRLFPSLYHQDDVKMTSFGQNGQWILTMDADHVVRLWETETRQLLSPPMHHTGFLVNAQFLDRSEKIVTEDYYGSISIWSLRSDQRSWEDLSRHVQLLTGLQKLEGGEFLPQTSSELLTSWEQLRHKYPDSFIVTPRQKVAWHRNEARNSRKAKVWFAAKFHLNSLLLHLPGDPKAIRRLEQAEANIAKDPNAQYGTRQENRSLMTSNKVVKGTVRLGP